MRKWTLILFSAVFTVVLAQEKKYEVTVIGFYNLENLFDTEESMHTINVDKLKEGAPNYVVAEDFDADKYYGSVWNTNFENVRISKSKTDLSKVPEVPTSALIYYKAKKKDYEERTEKSYSKKEFKTLVNTSDRWLNKKEFKTLVKENETITIPTNEILARVNDKENTPTGKRQYTDGLYQDKLNKLADVISQLGANYSEDGIALLGLAEVENEEVIRDLIKTGKLKESGFDVEHYECMYSRGVDVGLLYQTKYFEVVKSNVLQVELFTDKKETSRYYTRDILWVEGKLLGETVHVFVNHWPSRYGGEMKSSPGREAAATACKGIIDSLMNVDPNTQVILMGDLNDDPNNKSVVDVLETAKKREDVSTGQLFNPLYQDYKKGYGSLAYRGAWNLFDQVIVSSSFVDEETASWKLQDAEVVYNQDWINRFGGYEGGPNRSFGGNAYQGGYSDHLPSVIYLKRAAVEDKDKDGIADKDDDCPETAGIKAFNGCPDTDEDGIMDKEDLCPEEKGLAAFKGCPDTDGDGVEDSKDECPDEIGDKENNGCPYADTDGDGVYDKDDACKLTKGSKENNGCPELKEDVKEAVKAVFENLVFDTGKSTIRSSSDDELATLAKILNENPELLLTISGHTDNVGNDDSNMKLSKDRAFAVKSRLTDLGVAADRMEAFYFGETQPVATNDTAAGRQTNRRVVFEVKSR